MSVAENMLRDDSIPQSDKPVAHHQALAIRASFGSASEEILRNRYAGINSRVSGAQTRLVWPSGIRVQAEEV